MTHTGLTHTGEPDEVTDTPFLTRKRSQDTQACGVSQRRKDVGDCPEVFIARYI